MLVLHPRSSRQAAQTAMVRHLLAGMLGGCGSCRLMHGIVMGVCRRLMHGIVMGVCGRLMHGIVMGMCGRLMHGIVIGVCGRQMHGIVMGGVGAQGGEATRLVLMAVGVRIQRTRLLLIGGEIRDTLGAPGMGLATKWSFKPIRRRAGALQRTGRGRSVVEEGLLSQWRISVAL